MSLYIRLSCDVLTDPKFLQVGPSGTLLYIKGLAHAKQHMTDGYVDAHVLPILCLGMGQCPEELAGHLVDAQLWEKADGGFTVGPERWARWQETRAQVEEKQEVERTRKQIWREKKRAQFERRHVSRKSPSGTGGTCPVVVPSMSRLQSQSQSQSHITLSPPTPAGGRVIAEAAVDVYNAYPRHVGRAAALTAITKALRDVEAKPRAADTTAEQWLLSRVQAFAASAAGNNGKFTPHPSTWFNQGRYDDDDQQWAISTETGSRDSGKIGGPLGSGSRNSREEQNAREYPDPNLRTF